MKSNKKTLPTIAAAAAVVAASGTSAAHADTTDVTVNANTAPAVETVTPAENTSVTTEPTNLQEAETNLSQIEPAYQNAVAEQSNAQTNLNVATDAQNQAVESANQNAQALNDANAQLDSKAAELSDAKNDQANAQADVNAAEQALNKEVAKNPTAEADLTQAETDAQKANQAKVAAENHEADVQKEIAKADKSAGELANKVANEQGSVDALTKQSQDLAKTSADAHNAQLNAEGELAEKQTEVNTKVAKLQSDVDNASTDDIITYERTDAKTLNGFDYDRDDANEGAGKTKEVVITDGKETVNINLTPEQQLDYQSTGGFTYTPNMAEVNKHLVAYINRLREINGITDKVTTDDVAQAFAQARADELTKNDVLSHRSSMGHPHSWENIGGVMYNTSSNYFYNPYIVLSDQQFAYMELAHWFAEYRNAASGAGSVQYGHRLALLFSVGNVGFGATNKPSAGANEFDGYASLNVFAYPGQSSKSEALKNVTYETEDGRTVMYLNGKRVKFLPEITFNYVSNKKIVTPSTAKQDAQARLDAYKTEAAKELATAEAKVNEAKAQTADIDGQLAKVNADLASHQASLDSLKAELANSESISNDLKARLVEATADVNAAKADKEKADAKLAEIKAQNKALAEARTKYTEAVNKVETLKENVQKLESDIKGLTETRDSLAAKQDGLNKAVETAKVKVAEAKTAYEAAKTKANELTKAYVKAQADVLKFTPKEAPKPEVNPGANVEVKPGQTGTKANTQTGIKTNGQTVAKTNGQTARVQPGTVATQTANGTHVNVNYVAQATPETGSVKADDAFVGSRVAKHTNELPSTGDNGSMLGAAGLAIVSALGLAGFANRRRKNG